MHLCAHESGTCWRQKREGNHLKIELQATFSCPICVQGTELGSSTKEVLITDDMSPVPYGHRFILYLF